MPRSFICATCICLDFNSREQETTQFVHVINYDIQDNHEEATIGAFVLYELAKLVRYATRSSADIYQHISPSTVIQQIMLHEKLHSMQNKTFPMKRRDPIHDQSNRH